MKLASRVEVLNTEEKARIKQTAFRMLHEVGILIECPEAAAMMKRHGYRMDGQRLKPTPAQTQLFVHNYARLNSCRTGYARDEIVPRPRRTLGVADINILDWDLKQKRRGRLEDARTAGLFANGLDRVGNVYVVALPAEVHPELAAMAAIIEAARYTPKVGRISGGQQLTPRNLKHYEAMARLVAEGTAEDKHTPLFSLAGFDMSSPMRLSKFATNRTRMTMRFRCLGGSSTTLPLQGLTGPVSLAGCIAQSLAETFGGGMFLEMIEREMVGEPRYAFKMLPSFVPADMRHMREACSAVENTLGHIAIDQMLEYLTLPIAKYNYGRGKTEAKLWDVQNGYEKMLNMVFPLLGGIGWGPSAIGEMCTNDYFSFEQAIIDCELIAMGERIMQGITVDDAALDMEAFKQGAAQDVFTNLEHTVEHYREELFLPELASRESYEKWDQGGRLAIEEKAHQRVVEILEKAEPEPKYDAGLLAEMDALCKRFAKDFE